MYFRTTTLADLAGHVLGLSRAEVASRLSIAPSTLYAYRVASRFPSEKSEFRHALARLLAEAAQTQAVLVDSGKYVLSALYAEDRLFAVKKEFTLADALWGLEHTATQIALDWLPSCPPSAGPVEVLKALTTPAAREAKGLAAWWSIASWGSLLEVDEATGWRSTFDLPGLVGPREILSMLQKGRPGRRFLVPEMAAIDVVLSCADRWAVVEHRQDPPNAGEGPLLRLRLWVVVGEKSYETEGRVVSWHYGLR